MIIKSLTPPSIDEMLAAAKQDKSANRCGMYLTHCGVVREDAKAKVRAGAENTAPVSSMDFGYDEKKVNKAIDAASKMDGIFYVRVWLASGHLNVGDDIMRVLIGGDIRPHVVDCLNALVGEIKNNCVSEVEKF